MSGNDLYNALSSAGFKVRLSGLTNLTKLSPQAAVKALLDLDMRKDTIYDPVFPDDINTSDGLLVDCAVVQILSVTNIAQPIHGQSENVMPCTLQVKITDGHSKAVCLCLEPVPQLSTNSPPGTKIKIHSSTKYINGKIILTAANCTVLGGAVQSLIDTWKANRYALNLRKTNKSQSNAGNAPPKFDFKLCEGRGQPSHSQSSSSMSTPEPAPSASDKNREDYIAPLSKKWNSEDNNKKKMTVRSTGKKNTAAASAKSLQWESREKRNVYSDKTPSESYVNVKAENISCSNLSATKSILPGPLGSDIRVRTQDKPPHKEKARSRYPSETDKATPMPSSVVVTEPSTSSLGNIAWPELKPVSTPKTTTPAPDEWGTKSMKTKDVVASRNLGLLIRDVSKTAVCSAASGVHDEEINLMDFVKKSNEPKRTQNVVNEGSGGSFSWACSVCTFENHGALKTCEICGTDKCCN